MAALVTVQEIKNYLQIDSNVDSTSAANLSTIANYASKAIESFCGREFSSASVVEIHNGGRSSVFVNRIPINNVAEVAEYDGKQYVPLTASVLDTGELPNVEANASATPGFIFDPETGKISRDTGFDSGFPNLGIVTPFIFRNIMNGVKVTYNGGFDTIPDDLKLATLDYIKIIYKQEQGALTFSLEGESKEVPRLSANFPPHIRRILDLYRILN